MQIFLQGYANIDPQRIVCIIRTINTFIFKTNRQYFTNNKMRQNVK